MFSLEQLFLNNNNLNHIRYPDCGKLDEPYNECGSQDRSIRPFKSLRSLSLGIVIGFFNMIILNLVLFHARQILISYCLLFSGGNNIEDLQSIDSLNFFPILIVSITFLKDVSLKSSLLAQ